MKKARKSSQKSARKSSDQTDKATISRKLQSKALKSRAKNRNLASKSAKSEKDLFPIVGVGASAGGLEAFTRLIRHLSSNTGMAIVLVQHLDPEQDSRTAFSTSADLLFLFATALPAMLKFQIALLAI